MRSCVAGLADGDAVVGETVDVGVGKGLEDPPQEARTAAAATAAAIAADSFHRPDGVPVVLIKSAFGSAQPALTGLLSSDPLCMGMPFDYL